MEITDDILGVLKSDPDSEESLVGTISFQGREIELSIDPDDKTLDESLKTAREVVRSLEKLNASALSVASASLLDNYNENWRFFTEQRDDGTFEDFENPALTASEFEAAIRLEGVSINGGMLEFYYNDGGLFWGHHIIVSTIGGLNFEDADAELFG